MKHLLLSLLTIATLLPFSLSGMEKEKIIRVYKDMESRSIENTNTCKVIKALMDGKPISEITNLLKTLKNVNSVVLIDRGYEEDILTILRCALERCNPNNEEDVAFITLILEIGATLKQEPYDCWKPYLFYAIRQAAENNNNPTIVKLLIRYGANVNFRFVDTRGFGNSALNTAILHYDKGPACIKCLLKYGADTNMGNSIGLTPLATCALFAHEKTSPTLEYIVEKLLDHGAQLELNQYCKGNSYWVSNYDLLKSSCMPTDAIIKKIDKKKHTMAADFANAALNNLKANHSIIISGKFKLNSQEFKLNEAVLSTRCPTLCLELNPDYKKESHPQFKPLLHAPPLIRNINAFKQAAVNLEQTNQEKDRSTEITEID